MTLSEQADTSAEGVAPAELVAYETLDEGRIARIWLNRPEAHNAQNRTAPCWCSWTRRSVEPRRTTPCEW